MVPRTPQPWLRLVLSTVVTVLASQSGDNSNTAGLVGIGYAHEQGLAGSSRAKSSASGVEAELLRQQLSVRRLEESNAGDGGEGGKGGEGTKAEEGKGEEENVDETSLTVSFLLCGIVAFTVSLFYLVNYNDENIKRCTWELLSDTISIFCAVLWYQGVDALFDEHLDKEKENKTLRFLIGVLHFFFWYIGVQIVSITLCQSKTFGRISFKSSCVLGAHLSGFAAKEMFNTVMQAKPFRDSVGLAVVVVIMAMAALLLCSLVSYAIRNALVYPKMRESQREMCGEEIREIENDMVALSISFLISAVVRFAIHGKLPSEELDEKDDHEQWQAWLLYGLSLVFACGGCLCLKLQMGKEFNKHVDRLLDVAKMTFIMTMAWCLLFWGQWEIFDTHLVKRETLARVILALLLSYYGLIQVFALDFIADHVKSKFVKRSARLVTTGFGLALAFSWEQTFDVSIETIAKGTKHFSESGLKLLIAGCLCLLVAPAWAMYILPKTMEEESEEKAEVSEKAPLEGKDKGAGKAGAIPLPRDDTKVAPSEEPAVIEVEESPEELRTAAQADAPQPVGKAW